MKSLQSIHTTTLSNFSILLLSIRTTSLGRHLWKAFSLALIGFFFAPTAAFAIVGGEEAEQEKYQWMVGIAQADITNGYYAQFCGATLVDAQWVLTAAHCTYNEEGKPFLAHELDVIINRHQLSSNEGERISITQIVRHPLFDRHTFHADIALLQLATASKSAVVQLQPNIGSRDTVATVLGWGVSDKGYAVDTLRQAELPLVDRGTCHSAYSPYGYDVTSHMLCAGYSLGGIDACSGDSGGPLLVQDKLTRRWVQVGLVSWGGDCGQAGFFGVYTDVGQFVEWIDGHIMSSPNVANDNTVVNDNSLGI